MPGYKGIVPVGKPKKELHCSQCSLLLRQAMQTGEGDRICHSCWQEKKRGGVWSSLECYPDRAADREVQLLEVFCPRGANGCLWQGKLADLEEHFKECGKKPNLEVGIRKRKLEASSDEVHVHQITTALSLSGNVLNIKKKLRTKLREAYKLSQIQETHPGELLRVNREILAFSRQLSQHSRLLKQKLNAFGSACCTNFSELLQMNWRLQSQVLLHGPQLSAYQEMFTYLEKLENTLTGDMLKFKQWLEATVAGVSAIPLNHNRWCKRQKVCRNEANVEDPFGEQARGAWACTIEEKVENLQQELEKQGKKVEKLEETNEMLRNRVAELELLQKPPNIVQGQDDGDPQITWHVFHDCFDKIIKWIDVKAMVPQLMKHRIISGQDDLHYVTQGSPAQNVMNLYSKLSGSKNGFQIFYRCLRESRDEHLGHKDAADVLKQTAARKIEPGRSQLSPQSTRLL